MESVVPVITTILLLLLFCCCCCCCISISAPQSYRKELRTKNEVIKQLDTSSRPTTRVNPSRVTQLSSRPRVFLYQGFLSDEECNHLISLAHDKSEISGGARKIANSDQRTNYVTPLEIEQDDIVVKIEDRISAWTFLPKENSQSVKIMHDVSEDTKNSLGSYNHNARLVSSEPLLATLVLYLSNVTLGGETLFPKSESKNIHSKNDSWSDCAKTGYTVKPIKGNALLFFSLQPNAGPDESSSNARCPVLQGEMWCAIKFFHLKAIKVKKASSEIESDECADEEDSCPKWAALGECEKNPVYMKGTPDYSGSCRKSCNAC